MIIFNATVYTAGSQIVLDRDDPQTRAVLWETDVIS